jgi:nitrogen regulatory protein P-II 1
MLRVTMVVRPQRAEILCQRLLASELVNELQAQECRGYGRQKGHLEQYRGAEYAIDFLPKVLVMGWIEDVHKEAVIDLVCALCRTGRIGDGKIFFVPVERALEVCGPEAEAPGEGAATPI